MYKIFVLLGILLLIGCSNLDFENSYENIEVKQIEKEHWGGWVDGKIGYWLFYGEDICWITKEEGKNIKQGDIISFDLYRSGYYICKIK